VVLSVLWAFFSAPVGIGRARTRAAAIIARRGLVWLPPAFATSCRLLPQVSRALPRALLQVRPLAEGATTRAQRNCDTVGIFPSSRVFEGTRFIFWDPVDAENAIPAVVKTLSNFPQIRDVQI